MLGVCWEVINQAHVIQLAVLLNQNKHDGPCFPPCLQAATRTSSSDRIDTKTVSQLSPKTFQDIPAKLSCVITLDYLRRLSPNVWTHSDPSGECGEGRIL